MIVASLIDALFVAKIGKYIIKVSYDSVECLEQQEYQSVRNRYF